jgi:hypothetical protein
MINPGVLVKVIYVADQDRYTRSLIGKVGLIIERFNSSNVSDYVAYRYRVLIDEQIFTLHPLDIKMLEND